MSRSSVVVPRTRLCKRALGIWVRSDRGERAALHVSLCRAQVVCDCRRFQMYEVLSQNFSIEFIVIIEKAVR